MYVSEAFLNVPEVVFIEAPASKRGENLGDEAPAADDAEPGGGGGRAPADQFSMACGTIGALVVWSELAENGVVGT